MDIKNVKISKVTLNIGVGDNTEQLQKAEKLLQELAENKPVRTYARASIAEFNVKKHAPIGTKVTMRGKKAKEFLKDAFEAAENQIKGSQISANGNFSLGVKEYIELPGKKYDPDIGMFGFDVSVDLERIGFRIARRKKQKRKIPEKVQISREEVEKFISDNYSVVID